MRIAIWVLVISFGLLSRVLYAQEINQASIQVTPVRMVSCNELPNNFNFQFEFSPPINCEFSFQIDYLIETESENMIAIKDDSLVLDFIRTEEGSDISKYQNGRRAYALGSFPEVSEDGRHGFFSIEVNQNQFGKVENLSIKGTITILTASKYEEETVELSINNQEQKKVGPFSVEIISDDSQDTLDSGQGIGLKLVGPILDSGQGIGLKLVGPIDFIIEAKLIDGGQELSSEGYTSTSSNGYAEKTFTFPSPKSTEVLVSVRYWTNPQEQKVVFGQ